MSGAFPARCIEDSAQLAQSRAMKTSIMCLCLTTISAVLPSVQADPQPRQLTILIYDYSGWSKDGLNEVETVTTLLLSRAEIGTRWLHCVGPLADSPRPSLCDGDLTPETVLIRIIPAHLGQPSKLGDPLGAAVINVGYASVFASEVGRHADQFGLTPGTLMGYAVAHEIGHLLLGEKHAASGLMRAVWGKKEYNDMAQRWLGFSLTERQAMRDALTQRLNLGAEQVSLRPSKISSAMSERRPFDSTSSRPTVSTP